MNTMEMSITAILHFSLASIDPVIMTASVDTDGLVVSPFYAYLQSFYMSEKSLALIVPYFFLS